MKLSKSILRNALFVVTALLLFHSCQEADFSEQTSIISKNKILEDPLYVEYNVVADEMYIMRKELRNNPSFNEDYMLKDNTEQLFNLFERYKFDATKYKLLFDEEEIIREQLISKYPNFETREFRSEVFEEYMKKENVRDFYIKLYDLDELDGTINNSGEASYEAACAEVFHQYQVCYKEAVDEHRSAQDGCAWNLFRGDWNEYFTCLFLADYRLEYKLEWCRAPLDWCLAYGPGGGPSGGGPGGPEDGEQPCLDNLECDEVG